jgi:pyruvate kinase
MLLRLIQEGVDVCRINFSHGTHKDHLLVIELIRKINQNLGTHIAILGDLQGPKIRLGAIETPFAIEDETMITLTSQEQISNIERLFVTYPELTQDIGPGHRILIDDGKLELVCVERLNENDLLCKVVCGGMVLSKKGVNLPDTNISQPSLTKKDFADLLFALEHNLEWIALSFVRTEDEIIHLKKIIKEKNKHALVMAKIEKPEALNNIDKIIEVSDAIMVARGDLGVEVPIEQLPFIQKSLVRKCLQYSKPVVIATHIMESMITQATPTRAEVNDVVNAMLDGADALMLSAETASGKYPVKVVALMTKIMSEMENKDMIYNRAQQPRKESKTFLSDAVCYNACRMAEDVGAKAIIGLTRSGYTATMTSSYRPKAEIYIFSDNKTILNTLNLIFGVRPFYYDNNTSTDDTILELHQFLKDQNYLESGDVVINLASMPIKSEGRTNMLKVTKIK